MSVSLESLGIDRLSVGDRLELIEHIWDSLPDQVASEDIPQWHLDELALRRAAADHEPRVGKPYREVLAQLEAGQ